MSARSSSPPKNRSSSPPRSSSYRLQVVGALTVCRLISLSIRHQFTDSAVLEAKSLSPKEKHVGSAVHSGTEDPYCKVEVGKASQKTTSKVNTLAPRWNEAMIL